MANYRLAKEQLIEHEITEVAIKLDKNGNRFVKLTIKKEKELDGVKYQVLRPVLAFGSWIEKAQALKPGMILKAICVANRFKGHKVYKIHGFVAE
jgi:hypothetical protein